MGAAENKIGSKCGVKKEISTTVAKKVSLRVFCSHTADA
jgi:hypothetical protein